MLVISQRGKVKKNKNKIYYSTKKKSQTMEKKESRNKCVINQCFAFFIDVPSSNIQGAKLHTLHHV